MSYPKTKYGVGGGSVTVNDAHHEKALGEGWSDNEPQPLFRDDPPPALESDEDLTPAQKKAAAKAAKDAAKSAI